MKLEKNHSFPFGQMIQSVVQTDRSPKNIFVLGVYASAIHARWVDKDGKILAKALAVASEPEIFWTGHDAKHQIEKIQIPQGAGKLELPGINLNGPSGRALDELYLKPLKISRADAWLCDIIPETRLNPNQKNVIKKYYNPIRKEFNLPKATIPKFWQGELNSEKRRDEILKELFLSKADTLILLGDLPIKWFLNFYSDKKFENLASFGETPETYGRAHQLPLAGKIFNVMPLCHPRQAQRLGFSSVKWHELHKHWVEGKGV